MNTFLCISLKSCFPSLTSQNANLGQRSLNEINSTCIQPIVSYRHVCAIQTAVMNMLLNRTICSGNQLDNNKHCSRNASNRKHFEEDKNLENFAWLNQWGHMALANSFRMSNESWVADAFSSEATTGKDMPWHCESINKRLVSLSLHLNNQYDFNLTLCFCTVHNYCRRRHLAWRHGGVGERENLIWNRG